MRVCMRWVQGKGILSYGHHHRFQEGLTSHRTCHARHTIKICGPKTEANTTPVSTWDCCSPLGAGETGFQCRAKKVKTVVGTWGCGGAKCTVSICCAWTLCMITVWRCPNSRRHEGGRNMGAMGKRKRRHKRRIQARQKSRQTSEERHD